jgi:hypothetical protein
MSHPHDCGHAAVLLEAIGFQYSGQLPPEAFEAEIDPQWCELDEYLGWEIQSWPIFAVMHRRTGHGWTPLFEETMSVERIKVLILEGFKADCEKALGVGR